jgi:hypothetical protein
MNISLLHIILSKPHYERIEDMKYFYRLKDRKKVWHEDNIELNIGVKYLIHSPYSNKYFEKVIHEHTNVGDLEQKLYEGNIYQINSK